MFTQLCILIWKYVKVELFLWKYNSFIFTLDDVIKNSFHFGLLLKIISGFTSFTRSQGHQGGGSRCPLAARTTGEKLVRNVCLLRTNSTVIKVQEGKGRRASSGRPLPSSPTRHCNWLYGTSSSLDLLAMLESHSTCRSRSCASGHGEGGSEPCSAHHVAGNCPQIHTEVFCCSCFNDRYPTPESFRTIAWIPLEMHM